MRPGVRLKHLNIVQRGCRRYVYYRPKGEKPVRLPDLPHDDPRFLAAYAEAAGEAPRPPVTVGSLAAAVSDYKASAQFRGLADNTRNSRRRMLDDIAQKYGSGRVADLRAKHIRGDLNRLGGHAANNRLKAWRGLCRWMVDEQLVAANPSDGIAKLPTARSDGHEPWTAADVAAFRSTWAIETAERLAFELIYWTGARVSDAVRLGEGNVDADGWLAFRQQKTGGEVELPFRRALPDVAEPNADDLKHLHAALEARPQRHLTFMTTRRGAARSGKAVSSWFAEKCRAAGIVNRTAHGLRKSRAIALVEAGATTHQVAAWTGHETLAEIERYAARFQRRRVLTRVEQKNGEGTKSSNTDKKVPNRPEK